MIFEDLMMNRECDEKEIRYDNISQVSESIFRFYDRIQIETVMRERLQI